MTPFRLLGGLLLSFVLSSGAAQTVAEVQKLPLVHDPSLKTPRAQLSTADQQAVTTLARTLNARPEIRGLKQKWPYSNGAQPKDVLFTITAPFRSSTPERLTVFNIYEGEPPVLLFVLSGPGGITADVIEPVWNMNLCIVQQGYSLRDINEDGRREVAFTIGCGDGPWSSQALHIVRYGQDRWAFWRSFQVESSFGAESEGSEEQVKIYVQKGKTPQFYGVLNRKAWEISSTSKKSPIPDVTVGVIKYAPTSLNEAWRVRHLF